MLRDENRPDQTLNGLSLAYDEFLRLEPDLYYQRLLFWLGLTFLKA